MFFILMRVQIPIFYAMLARLSISGSTVSVSQIRTKSQEALRHPRDCTPHRVRSVDDIRLQNRVTGSRDDDDQHQILLETPEEELWELQEEEEDEVERRESKARGEPQACLFVARYSEEAPILDPSLWLPSCRCGY